jgi:hypothetical protein
MPPKEAVTPNPCTDAAVYELDFANREWLAAPATADLPARLRALFELWRGENPTARFAMLVTAGSGHYSLDYFRDLAALAVAIDSTNQHATTIGVAVPWRLELLPGSKAALSALLPQHGSPGASPSTH